MTTVPLQAGDRKSGTVDRVLGDYGFISSDELPDQDLYFKASWFRGSPPLREGERVTFQHKVFGANHQAHLPARETDHTAEGAAATQRVLVRPSAPSSERLLEWAYLSYMPNVLATLKGLALQRTLGVQGRAAERCTAVPDSAQLSNSDVWQARDRAKGSRKWNPSVAAFNTGLVDPRYEPIHALFVPNDDPRAPWQLEGLCIAGEGADGQKLVRHFSPLPSPAHYFGDPMDLLYDTRAGKPELDWQHVIIERIDRYPAEFVTDHWPPGFAAQDATA